MRSFSKVRYAFSGALTAFILLLTATSCTTVPPQIGEFIEGSPYYISPLNGDGVQDTLNVPVDIRLDPRGLLRGYAISVTDSDGTVVRLIHDEISNPGFFKRITNAISPGKRETVETPDVILWDGRNDGAEFVPDGSYTVVLDAWDYSNRRVTTEPVLVVVDNTAPQIEISAPYLVFSPNGDGNKDVLPISQAGSREDTWRARLIGADGLRAVLEIEWAGLPPVDFTLTGLDSNDEMLPDGLYTYEVGSTDRAGNTTIASIEDIGINKQATLISVGLNRFAFSPNGDGKADELLISPVIPAAEIEGWVLDINDSLARRMARFTGIESETIVWNGTNTLGTRVPDGEYFLDLSATYRNGNSPRVRIGPVYVDTVRPNINMTVENPLFSPDGDNLKDTFIARHGNATIETAWISQIIDRTGTVVRTTQWNGVPDAFVFDGKADDGSKLPDGTYTYRISALDEADNEFAREYTDVRIDTRPTRVSITTSGNAISPNGDGVQDFLTIIPSATPSDGIAGWTMRVKDEKGEIYRRVRGTGLVPVAWGGISDFSTRVPDGRYLIEFEVTHEKGNRAIVVSNPVTVDTVRPKVEVRTAYSLFSPDGDGRRDTLSIEFSGATEETEWVGEFKDFPGNTVRTLRWPGRPVDFTWNGAGDSGSVMPDGTYAFVISAKDAAGNIGTYSMTGLHIETRAFPVAVRVSGPAFSPNGDEVMDTITFLLEAETVDGIESWRISVRDRTSNTVKSFSGQTWTNSVIWDGRGDSGRVVPDGTFTASLSVEYKNGSVVEATTSSFTVDTVFPTASVIADSSLFSPDGDGRKDELTIRHTDISTESLWIGQFVSSAGAAVRTYRWTGKPVDVSWDGKTDAGNISADGAYTYRLTSVDSGGNRFESSIPGLRLDTRETPVQVRINGAGFSPNGDGNFDALTIETRTEVADGLAQWRIEAVDARSNARYTILSGGRLTGPAQLIWNGSYETGGVITEGAYYVAYTVEYAKGNRVQERTAEFVVDTTGPVLALSMSPETFSPDGDRVDDTIRFTHRASDPNGIQSWQLQVYDPTGVLFTRFTGFGDLGSPIVWDGKAPGGELVQAGSNYRAVLSATDNLGNTSEMAKPVSVDVYVIPEGDRLRIQLSSIYFAPFVPDFAPEKEEENWQVLRRLAEVLQKYRAYKIRIEGHAVRIYWFNEAYGQKEEVEELAPLSLARAETVKRALVSLGIEEARMTTAGFGGLRPVVPHSDLVNRWKNRRAEFILEK